MSEPDFKKIEEKVLRFWNDRRIFERSLENRKDKKRFVFFEGPPTANGRPGIHHFIGRVFKDLWPRYMTMRGYFVARKAGWDTHGLPVEIEVEKDLGLKNKKDIEKYGIAKFNEKAKQSVWKYKDEWQKFTHRIGFWLDLQDPYITYDSKYMESLWWIIKQIDKKGLLYEGHKIIPWCTRCGTGLSSHELAQGYKEVTDTSVTWKFAVKNQKNTYLLAWTTTPWSTLSTMGLSVGPEYTYVKAKVGDQYLILVKDRLDAVLAGSKYEIVEEFKGKKLIGTKYEPFVDMGGPYQVYPADYVELTDGTGIVTINGSYGEIDMEQAKKCKLPIVMDVDPDGKFNNHAGAYAGLSILDGQKKFIEDMETKGLIWKTEPYTHSYPHCWRCKTALIYYAKDSWFVAMSKLRKQLLGNNSKVNWYPEHLKEGRFGEFLREVKDWAFSRERYWGTPLPVWKCEECKNKKVIGSFSELEEKRYYPKTNLFLLRHGESGRNLPENELIPAYNLEDDHFHLTEKGKKQIATLSWDFTKEKIDYIYTSPFLRTVETAKIISGKTGIPIVTDNRLAEYNPEKEDSSKMRTRMMDLANEVNIKHREKNVLFVSHGFPIATLVKALNNASETEIVSEKWENFPKVGELVKTSVGNFPYNKNGALDPHRPYIDEIFLKCDKCPSTSSGQAGKMTRVKEVIDVWFDSGAMPFAQLGYPISGDEILNKNFPADFICEAIDQTRGWFYTLLAVSTVLGKKPPYKNVLCYSHVLDAKGKKMSKSIGNVVNPWDVIDKYGVDPVRWYFYSANSPGDPKLFNPDDVGKIQRGFIATFLNCLRFFELMGDKTDIHKDPKPKIKEPIDNWIVSRLNKLIGYVTQELNAYNPTTASRALENFVIDDLSNWWLRRSRNRFPEAGETLRHILLEISKLSAPFIPFTADHVYKQISNRRESVHLEDWPTQNAKYINNNLESEMAKARNVSSLGLAQRKAVQIKVRQPLASVSVKEKIGEDVEKYILEELNVKKALFAPSQAEDLKLDTNISEELKLEGFAREIARTIQEMRKDAKYRIDEKVSAYWASSSPKVKTVITAYGKKICDDTILKCLDPKGGKMKYDVKSEFELEPAAKIWIGLKK